MRRRPGGDGGVLERRTGLPRGAGHDRDVGQPRLGARAEQDGAGQAGVVEEVVEVVLAALAAGLLDEAGRDRVEGEAVVDGDREPNALPLPGQLGDVRLERRVAADVADDRGLVHPHLGGVGRRAEPQEDPLPGEAARDPDRALVPDVADVLAHGAVRDDVVVAGRHRHPASLVERAGEPALGAATIVRVEAEAPQPVEGDDLAGLSLIHI